MSIRKQKESRVFMYFIKRIFKLWLFRIKYFSKNVKLASSCSIGISSQFEGLNTVGNNTRFDGYLGYGTYVMSHCKFGGKIGKYSSIAENVVVINAKHPIEKYVSTHPVFYSLFKQNGASYTSQQNFDEYLFADAGKKYPVIIGNDVWIGHGVTLIGGITIGDGAIVLANATVTKDVSPYSIVGGIPAKLIRKRFDDFTIEQLLKIQWWTKPEKYLRDNVNLFYNIDEFIKNWK